MDCLQSAKELMNVLIDAGYETYIVGGYVRDRIIKRASGDIDIATSANPEVVQSLFKRTVPTGIKHGTVTVIHNKYQFEVTTFRSEGDYSNNRHPDLVDYVKTFKEDVSRRDFTMNALGLAIDDTIIDYVNGQHDINNQLIKTVGDADIRIKEDALRMLRAFRFVSKLGFTLDPELKCAINTNRDLIKQVSLERIIKEFEYMIQGEDFLKAISEMIESSFYLSLDHFLNGLQKMHEAQFKPNHFNEFLAVCTIFSDSDILEKLPVANVIKKEVQLIHEMYELEITDMNRILLFRNGLDVCLSVDYINHKFRNIESHKNKIIELYNTLPIYKQCDLKFKGDHIIQFYDRKPGGWISDVLDDICLKVLLGELENDFEKIRQYLLKKQ